MPVKRIVENIVENHDKENIETLIEKTPFGQKITYDQYMKLRANYELQNRTVNQNGVTVRDSTSAWVPISDIIMLMNKVFKEDVLSVKDGFENIGIKIYYGAHNENIAKEDVSDAHCRKEEYAGLHTVMLVATNQNYNPDKGGNNPNDILDNPKKRLPGDDTYLVDGVHLCEPNCP